MSDDRDREEVRAARDAGGADAVARLLDRHRDRLRRAVEIRMDPFMRGRIDASDVIQETLVEAAGRVDDYLGSPGDSLYIWLRMLAHQRFLQLRRYHIGAKKRDARREVRIDGPPGEHSTTCQFADILMASTTSPSSNLGRSEKRAVLLAAIEELGKLDQEILILRIFEELSNGETARVLGINESTASTRFLRSLKRLRVALGDAE
jgi:RNA polymerase sigma-70 factor (ECF subfamily)